MKTRRRIPAALAALLDRQGGTATRQQVYDTLGRGALRRLLAEGKWARVTPGTYAACPAPSLEHRLWAGFLIGGPGSALGGWAALHAAGQQVSVPVVDVWSPDRVRREPRPGYAFHSDGLGRLEHTSGSLPRIRLEDALLDLVGAVDLDEWVNLTTSAARERRISLLRLRSSGLGRPRMPRRPLLREVLADLAGIESTLEWRYHCDVERAHGLPPGERQKSLSSGTRSDVVHDAYRLIVELDGLCHTNAVLRDLARDNTHTAQGQSTLRYGSLDVRLRACAVAAQVAQSLQVRAWPGTMRRCPRCPPSAPMS